MTTHVCRDLLLGGVFGTASGSYDTMWSLMVFMQGVLGYTVESQAGNLVPPTYSDFTVNYYSASGNTLTLLSSSVISKNNPCALLTSSNGHTLLQFSRDTVNLLSAAYPQGWASGSGPWPGLLAGVLTASYGDIFKGSVLGTLSGSSVPGRSWAALRSSANPGANSGIFSVIDTTTWLNYNAVEIDYRSTSTPPVETSYLSCSMWQAPPGSDKYNPTRMGSTWPLGTPKLWTGNGSAGYNGNGTSTYPRAMLVSPSSLGYRVRVAIETPVDSTFHSTITGLSIVGNNQGTLTAIPGMSGSGGDFPSGTLGSTGSLHLHIPSWFNYGSATALRYAGGLPGLDTFTSGLAGSFPEDAPVQFSFYAWGDDVEGSVVAMVKNDRGSANGMIAFGQAHDETLPLASSSIQRLFAIGKSNNNGVIGWDNAWETVEGITGIAYSWNLAGGPISCVMSTYAWVAIQQLNSNNIIFDSTAGATPFGSNVELTTVDLLVGTLDSMYDPQGGAQFNNVFPIEPRRIGRFPIARWGISTGQPQWSPADPAGQWFHTLNGVYLPWGGVTALSSSAATSPITDLTPSDTNVFYTGSVEGNATSVGVTVVSSSTYSGIFTGSWMGLGNSWGTYNLSSSLSASLHRGLWKGNDTSWGFYFISTGSLDRLDSTANATPSPNQGLSEGAWDPFPTPVTPEAAPQPPRDLTRYRKSYSAGRNQPVRIRLIR